MGALLFKKPSSDKISIKQVLCKREGVGFFISKSYCKILGFNYKYFFNKLPGNKKSAVINEKIKDQIGIKKRNLNLYLRKNIEKFVTIRCYRGQRHKKGLPLRGQRTHTNG